jgi:putative membrane protein
MKKIVSLFFSIVLVLLGLSFSILNADLVKLNLYLKTWELPLSLVVISALILGVLLGFLVAMIKIVSLKRLNNKLRKKADIAEKEISNLRTIPIKDIP